MQTGVIDLTAEARKALSEEFLIKKYFVPYELCTLK